MRPTTYNDSGNRRTQTTTNKQEATIMTQEAILYDTMHDYAKEADITHYMHSNVEPNAPKILIEAFQPSDDPYFFTNFDDKIIFNGNIYVLAGWGEEEKSYLRISAIYETCYIRYVLYLYPINLTSDYAEYISDGIVYETYNAARRNQQS